jgi:hypothetical protein
LRWWICNLYGKRLYGWNSRLASRIFRVGFESKCFAGDNYGLCDYLYDWYVFYYHERYRYGRFSNNADAHCQ